VIPVIFKRTAQSKTAPTSKNPLRRGTHPSHPSQKISLLSRFSFLYPVALGALFYLTRALNHLS
jgi:hypothetical protein